MADSISSANIFKSTGIDTAKEEITILGENTSNKRFSWDRLLHEGQERLASIIDFDTHVSNSDEEHELDCTDQLDDSPESIYLQGSGDDKTPGKSDLMAEVFGLAAMPSSSFLRREKSYNENSSYMELTRTTIGDNSQSSTVGDILKVDGSAATTRLEVEGDLINSYEQLNSESPIDRMRRTMRRHSELNRKMRNGLLTNDSSIPEDPSSKYLHKSKRTGVKAKMKEKASYFQSKKVPDISTPPQDPTLIDKLMDRLVTTALPTASLNLADADWRAQNLKSQPAFSINTMGRNFRNLTSRMGVVFDSIYTVQEILSWKNPFFTISAISIYSYLILNPRLIPIAPLLFISFRLMVPAYLHRHPPDPNWIRPSNPIPALGPPLADVVMPKPVPELSREFFYNVVDIQNIMVLYIDGYDMVMDFLQRFAFFHEDETASSLAFVILIILSILFYFAVPFIILYTPWRFVFLVSGWTIFGLLHPRFREKLIDPLRLHFQTTSEKGKKTLNRVVSSTRQKVGGFPKQEVETSPPLDVFIDVPSYQDPIDSASEESSEESSDEMEEFVVRYERFWKAFDDFAYEQFNYYEPHEQREVELFEVQCIFKIKSKSLNIEEQADIGLSHKSSSFIDDKAVGHWGMSIFSNHPYLPVVRGSAVPSNFSPGAASLSEVQPPLEWQYVPGGSWKLDLNAAKWVASRGVPVAAKTGATFVFVDDDEKWVYDKHPVIPKGTKKEDSAGAGSSPSLGPVEEKPKMYIRRRRWTRICTRRVTIENTKP